MLLRRFDAAIALLLLIGIIGIFGGVTYAGAFIARAPEDFVRGRGVPVIVTRTFAVLDPSAAYTLVVHNGGSANQYKLVSSAVITLNGTTVLGPSDFNQPALLIRKTVKLLGANTLTVELRSIPDSGITIQFAGIDNTPPTITAFVSRPANAAGWYNADVVVSFTCSDLTSGIASCPAPVTVSTEGANQTITGTAVDGAGNTASASVAINMDKTPPTLVVTSPLDGATVADPSLSITGSVSDSLSGVTGVTCNATAANFLPDAKFACTVELGGGATTLAVKATDAAGNSSTKNLTVTLNPNEAPRVTAGADQTVEMPTPSRDGKIVVAHDEFHTTNTGFEQTPAGSQRFILNVAQWFKGAPTGGRFLVISNNFSLDPAQATTLKSTLLAAGHSYTKSTDLPGFSFDVTTLRSFDGVFLACPPSLGNSVLISYVNAGGHVYLNGGTAACGGGAGAEAASWNTFLNAFGLTFDPGSYNGVIGIIPISNPYAHPVLDGVTSLYQFNGNFIRYFGTTGAQIIESLAGIGLFAVFQAQGGATFATVDLKGTVVDDGLPAGAMLNAAWSKVSGPGTVTFANGTIAVPDVLGTVYPVNATAFFTEPGVYVLRLTASDSDLTNSADVTVTVRPPVDQPLTVSAGTNQTITQPN